MTELNPLPVVSDLFGMRVSTASGAFFVSNHELVHSSGEQHVPSRDWPEKVLS